MTRDSIFMTHPHKICLVLVTVWIVLLQSALVLTEVLKEREAQIELKKMREASVCGENKETLAKLREAYEESLRIDREEKQRAREAKMKTVDFQKAQ